jgi:putative glutamine amidotransferase
MAQDAGQDSERPCIGVTGSAKRFSWSWYAIRLSVFLAGGRAIRITPVRRYPQEHLDAVIVSGGDDSPPGLYESEELPDKEYDHDRDELEQSYIRYALDESLPLMGICRGYQLINVMMGGSLHLDIRKMRQNTSNFGTILPRKTVQLEPGSFIAHLTERLRLRVNSLHYQAVDRVGEELSVTGRDLDEFVQVLEHGSGAPILGVQWHPEYLFYLPTHLRLFRWLVDQARARKVQQS